MLEKLKSWWPLALVALAASIITTVADVGSAIQSLQSYLNQRGSYEGFIDASVQLGTDYNSEFIDFLHNNAGEVVDLNLTVQIRAELQENDVASEYDCYREISSRLRSQDIAWEHFFAWDMISSLDLEIIDIVVGSNQPSCEISLVSIEESHLRLISNSRNGSQYKIIGSYLVSTIRSGKLVNWTDHEFRLEPI